MSNQGNFVLSELSWPEVQEAIDDGAVVVVPMASTEQHGRHLPLETDSRLCKSVAERACKAALADGTPVLIAPTVWLGYSPHHMDFPGTMTVDSATFSAVVVAIGRSLWQHGFRKIFFLNGHGGNSNLLRAAMQDLRFEHEIRATAASYWDFVPQFIEEWRESELGGINHACEMETSLMLAVRPDLVDLSKAEDSHWFPRSSFISEDLAIGAPVSVNWSHEELHPSGSLGDPRLSTAERGQVLLDEIVKRVATFLTEYARWDWEHPLEN
jgi:creatinine amidohydrolase